MGSGPQANRESSLALRLLEQFLQAGVETEHALVTLNSALALRGEEAGGFTTVDLLQVDLFTGMEWCLSWGRPYLCAKGRDCAEDLRGFPPGGAGGGGAERPRPLSYSPVPWGLCASGERRGDGTEDDSWLRERLVKFDQGSPKELARDLITHSPQGATDDSTAW